MGEAFEEVSNEMDELVNGFYPAAVVGDTTVGITVYVVWFTLAMIAMLAVLFAYKRSIEGRLVPHGVFANAVDYGVEFISNDICKGVLGDTWKQHFPFLATVFFVVLFGNYIGMLPTWKAGTGSTGITGAIALASFIYFIYVGIKKHGVLGYLKTFTHGLKGPMAAPIWFIELFSTFLRLITLAVRLFCNMFAGHIVMGTFAILTSVFAQQILTFAEQGAAAIAASGVSVVWELILIIIYAVELMVAVIQAFVFALLTAVYVQTSEEEI